MKTGLDTTLVCGFLDTGKTTYIQDLILHDYFWKYGKTLILCFETGEQLYDETVLAEKNTNVAYYESGEDITAFCMQKIREAAPDRVYVEMNCMIPNLKDRLPKELKVTYTSTIIDFRTLDLYLTNLRQYMLDMVREASMVTFLNCNSKDALAPFSQIFRLMNPKATYLRKDSMGYHEKAFDPFLPYSLEDQIIQIGRRDYITFCLDAGEHPEHYDGKTLIFLLPLEVRTGLSAGDIICGRMVMTCCMADIQFMGQSLMVGSESRISCGWISLEARGSATREASGIKRLVLFPEKMESSAFPEGDLFLKAGKGS